VFTTAALDVARLLRCRAGGDTEGPQSLYFGKSTVAGAVVLTTANPTDEFEASVTAGHEFEAEQWYTQGYVSGRSPIPWAAAWP